MNDLRLRYNFREAPASITPRERQVLDLVVFPSSLIAEQLGITTHTVKTHLKRAYLKLGVESRAQAAVVWQQRRAA